MMSWKLEEAVVWVRDMKGRANRLFVEKRVMGGFVGDGAVMERRGTMGLRP